MISTEDLFIKYCKECGMDDDDIRACSWHKSGMIEFADWLLRQTWSQPNVSDLLPFVEQSSLDEAISDVITISTLNEYSVAKKLIGEQFLVIDKQDLISNDDNRLLAVRAYKCNHCGKIVNRESNKKWIKSYCDATGKDVRLLLVKA